ncbi:uncharacterized protein VICG_00644 [Vittaforma corneae ATCC 50505]|uniref:Exocyst complex component Sec8 N-terminal domain-containing protein n=1 Tax=Vittaforma corneae (strain ATCC 50505) TaxID=993615 RepID=L2GP16_VITCO|nr:uncharacterized protein VICG_00644 [Vittaforma corneae ATCC 50505]ELA42245.1 hypothetical protein VICG_00644 [Vittaforma corneae ATCC 50505]
MEEGKNILKELKVDWDQTLHENFNPLQMALRVSSNPSKHREFHGMLHRLEQTMDKIISSNFQGFSEAFQTFSDYKQMNNTILNTYCDVENKLASLHIIEVLPSNENVLAADLENQEIKAKYEICAMIADARNLYKSFLVSQDPTRKSELIVKALSVLGDPRLFQIKGVFEYYKIILRSYQQFSDEINKKLLDFIVRNEIENSHFYNVVVDLQSISKFDDYCLKHFQKEVFRLFEDIILVTSKSINDEDPINVQQGGNRISMLEVLCVKIAKAVECIIDNMSFIINKSSAMFVKVDQEDFFGKKKSEANFIFDLSGCMNALRGVLRNFLDRYSFEPEKSDQFDINFIADTFDYTKVYDENSSIYQRLMKSSKKIVRNGSSFTLITPVNPETISFLLKYIQNHEIRSFLYQTVETRLFSDAILNSKIGKIQQIINEICDSCRISTK